MSEDRNWTRVEFKQLPPELMLVVNDRDDADKRLQGTRRALRELDLDRQVLIQQLNALDTRIIQERQREENEEQDIESLEYQISTILIQHLSTGHFTIQLYEQGDESDVPF